MKDEYMSSADIKEKIAELKIRLAFQLEFEEELKETLAECEKPDPDMIRLVRESEEELLNEIYARTRKARGSGSGRRALARAGKIAVVLAAALTISFGSALAAIHMVEAGLLKIDIEEYEERTSYGLTETGAVVDVPPEWTGLFYPSYIPEGYTFREVDRLGAWYVDAEGNEFVFEENDLSARRSADTPDAEASKAWINGEEADVHYKDGWTTVVWCDNNRCFSVMIRKDKEIALRIAASVTLIR